MRTDGKRRKRDGVCTAAVQVRQCHDWQVMQQQQQQQQQPGKPVCDCGR